MLIKSFFTMIMKDFWEKKLVPLKLIFFLETAASSVLFSYLTLYKLKLGINGRETATVDAVTCLIAIVVPPFAGLLADRIGNFKLLLSLFSALGGAAALLLLFVPVGRSTAQFPPNFVFTSKNCYSEALVFETDPNFPCDTVSNAKTMLKLDYCGYACAVDSLNDSYIEDILDSRSYKLVGKNVTYIATSEGLEVLYNFNKTFTEYSTTAQQISKDVFFFPAERPKVDVIFSTNLKAIDEGDKHRRYVTEDIVCIFDLDEVVDTASVEVALRDEAVKFDKCDESCLFIAPAGDICSKVKGLHPKIAFWAYLGIRIFMGILEVATITMFEGAVIAILREEKADYGLQKIYGIVAGMMASPLCDMLIAYVSRDKGYLDFRPAFYLHAGLKVLQGMLMLTINLDFKKPTPNVTSAVTKVLRNVEMVGLLIACVGLGSITGFIKSLTFWSLQHLQASSSLIEISMISGVIAGFIFLLMSGQIINAFGHAKLIFVSFTLYMITLLGYSLIDEPTLCPILETLESATTSLSSVAVVTYAGKLSTWMTDGSIQGLLRSLYNGVGYGSGSLISGYFMKALANQIFAIGALMMSLGYFWFNWFLSKQGQNAEIAITEKEYKKSYKRNFDEKINVSHYW